jgi:hypothetical protein
MGLCERDESPIWQSSPQRGVCQGTRGAGRSGGTEAQNGEFFDMLLREGSGSQSSRDNLIRSWILQKLWCASVGSRRGKLLIEGTVGNEPSPARIRKHIIPNHPFDAAKM